MLTFYLVKPREKEPEKKCIFCLVFLLQLDEMFFFNGGVGCQRIVVKSKTKLRPSKRSPYALRTIIFLHNCVIVFVITLI